MGVNIVSLLPREEIKFEDLKNKIVGVDAFNILYQFLSSIRGADGTPLKDSEGRVTSHLQGLFSRSLNLMSKGIKLVYVFDGEPPKLKLEERERRISLKAEAKEKYKEAMQEEDIEEMYKYSKRISRLDEEMIEESKELIKALGLPVVQAPSEAEAQAAFMCNRGDVYGVASQDSDSLLFEASRLIRNLTLSQRRRLPSGKYVITFLELITLKEVLKSLDINQDQLIVLSILVGTDYNIGGVKGIGPKKALKLVKENKDYDKMFETLDVEFDWKEIFNIFKKIPVKKDYKLKWGKVNDEKIKEILVERHDFSLERISNLIDKYKKENKMDGQKGLGEFF